MLAIRGQSPSEHGWVDAGVLGSKADLVGKERERLYRGAPAFHVLVPEGCFTERERGEDEKVTGRLPVSKRDTRRIRDAARTSPEATPVLADPTRVVSVLTLPTGWLSRLPGHEASATYLGFAR
jgi:hypothetical protein